MDDDVVAESKDEDEEEDEDDDDAGALKRAFLAADSPSIFIG
jgi:hypothetical protein